MTNLCKLALILSAVLATAADLVLLEAKNNDSFISNEEELLDVLAPLENEGNATVFNANRQLTPSRYGLVSKYNRVQLRRNDNLNRFQNGRIPGQAFQRNIINGGSNSNSRERRLSSSSSSESRSRENVRRHPRPPRPRPPRFPRPHRHRWRKRPKRPKKPKRRCQPCPPGWEDQRNRYGKCYKEFCHGTCKFDNAVLTCKTIGVRGSKLVEPNLSNGELTFLLKFVRVVKKFWWIAIKRINNNFQFIESGRIVAQSLISWAPGEPNRGKNEDCVALRKLNNNQQPGVFDSPCGDIWGFAICEVRRRPCRRPFG